MLFYLEDLISIETWKKINEKKNSIEIAYENRIICIASVQNIILDFSRTKRIFMIFIT